MVSYQALVSYNAFLNQMQCLVEIIFIWEQSNNKKSTVWNCIRCFYGQWLSSQTVSGDSSWLMPAAVLFLCKCSLLMMLCPVPVISSGKVFSHSCMTHCLFHYVFYLLLFISHICVHFCTLRFECTVCTCACVHVCHIFSLNCSNIFCDYSKKAFLY